MISQNLASSLNQGESKREKKKTQQNDINSSTILMSERGGISLP